MKEVVNFFQDFLGFYREFDDLDALDQIGLLASTVGILLVAFVVFILVAGFAIKLF